MSNIYDLIIKNGNCFINNNLTQTDIGIKNNKIIKIGSIDNGANKILDAKGLTIIPGAIDTQVHFREPGLTHKEDLESGSLAAVMGGVTSVFEMPNTDPQTTTDVALADKVKRGTHRMHCDFAFWVGGTHDNPKHIPELEHLPGAVGIKVFMGSSTGSLLVEDDQGVAVVLDAG